MESFGTRLVAAVFDRQYGAQFKRYLFWVCVTFSSAAVLSLLILLQFAFEGVAKDVTLTFKVLFAIGFVLIWLQLGITQAYRYRRRLMELPLSGQEVSIIRSEVLDANIRKELAWLDDVNPGLTLGDVARAHREVTPGNLSWATSYCPD